MNLSQRNRLDASEKAPNQALSSLMFITIFQAAPQTCPFPAIATGIASVFKAPPESGHHFRHTSGKSLAYNQSAKIKQGRCQPKISPGETSH